MPDPLAAPDFEVIAVDHLKADGTVTAVVDADQISTKLRRPWQAGDVAIRVRRIGGLQTEGSSARLKRGRLQVECFAPTETVAFDGCAKAVASLLGLEGTTSDDDVVTAARQDLGITNSPDPDSDAERFLAGVVLYGHRTAG